MTHWPVLLVLLVLLGSSVTINGLRVLVAGGSGFVGGKLVSLLAEKGLEVVSVSRRGVAPTGATGVKCDVADKDDLEAMWQAYGPFDGCFHAIGLLLDSDSGLSSFNKFASGSGSIPGTTSNYDRITRQTSFNLMDAIIAQRSAGDPIPFIFVSAAEAGWTLPSPIPFLERYLVAKRAVEKRMQEEPSIRPIIMRPSLIYTMNRPQALVSVIPFMVASKLGVPGVEKPVELEVLTNAAVVAFEDGSESGIKRIEEMTALSKMASR